MSGPGPGGTSVTEALLHVQLELAAQAQATEVEAARILAEEALLCAVDFSVAPPSPLLGPLHMNPASLDVV